MNSISLMEWNSKPPLPWDWENLVMFNATTSENPKPLQATNVKTDGQRRTDSGSFHWSGSGSGSGSGSSSGGVSGSGAGGSCSDLGFPSLSKGSKSPSINSSSTGEVKTSKSTVEASAAIPPDFSYKKDLAKSKPAVTSPTIEASVGSGEPLLDLKLGKRTYFEDICGGSNAKSPSSHMIPVSSVTPAKRLKSSNQGMHVARCQVEGCNLDLSSAKVYHRKHRVCESHTKCPMVIVAGLERRFCQQCSRFHGLSEFDEKKRSCRRRLSDHNARRRKAQPGSVHLNPARLSSSLYDERRPMSFVWESPPLVCTRPNTSPPWEGTSGSKFTITKEYIPKPEKLGFDGSLHLPRSCPTNAIGVQNHHISNGLLPYKDKDTPAKVLRQGLKGSIISSNVDTTPDLHRALSLLSTNSWGSCEPQSVSVEQPMRANSSSMPQSVLHVLPQSLPLASSEYWRTEQHPADSRVHTLTSHNDGNSYFQKFQLLRTANENGFCSGQIN